MYNIYEVFNQCFSQKQLFHPYVRIRALYSDWGPRLAAKDYDDVTGTLKSSLRHSRGCPATEQRDVSDHIKATSVSETRLPLSGKRHLHCRGGIHEKKSFVLPELWYSLEIQ